MFKLCSIDTTWLLVVDRGTRTSSITMDNNYMNALPKCSKMSKQTQYGQAQNDSTHIVRENPHLPSFLVARRHQEVVLRSLQLHCHCLQDVADPNKPPHVSPMSANLADPCVRSCPKADALLTGVAPTGGRAAVGREAAEGRLRRMGPGPP